MSDIDIDDAIMTAQKVSFDIEMILIKDGWGVTAEQHWQQGLPLIVRFLMNDFEDSTYNQRKTTLQMHTERVKNWLLQDPYKYQGQHPQSRNDKGGSVVFGRASREINPDNFIQSCMQDIKNTKELYDNIQPISFVGIETYREHLGDPQENLEEILLQKVESKRIGP